MTAWDWTALSSAAGSVVLTVSIPSVSSTSAERPFELASARRLKTTASRTAVLPPSGSVRTRSNSASGCSRSKRSRRWVWSKKTTRISCAFGRLVRKRTAACCERRSVSSMLSLVSTSKATSSEVERLAPAPMRAHSSIFCRRPSSARTKSRAVSPSIGRPCASSTATATLTRDVSAEKTGTACVAEAGAAASPAASVRACSSRAGRVTYSRRPPRPRPWGCSGSR